MTNEPSIEKINQKLAEFAGYKPFHIFGENYQPCWVDTTTHNEKDLEKFLDRYQRDEKGMMLNLPIYTNSVDACLPLVDKLPLHEFSLRKNNNGWWCEFNVEKDMSYSYATLKKEAALTLSKAIYSVLMEREK